MRWLCVPCVTPHIDGDIYLDGCALVEAPAPEEAAAEAHDLISDESTDLDPDYTCSMFVIPFHPEEVVACRRGVAFERADPEWQCCAGPIEFTDDGHSGFCPKGKKEET